MRIVNYTNRSTKKLQRLARTVNGLQTRQRRALRPLRNLTIHISDEPHKHSIRGPYEWATHVTLPRAGQVNLMYDHLRDGRMLLRPDFSHAAFREALYALMFQDTFTLRDRVRSMRDLAQLNL